MRKCWLIIGVFFAVFIVSCGKKQDTAQTRGPSSAPALSSQPEAAPAYPSLLPAEDFTSKSMDPLTGLWIQDETALSRPIAVVINNHHKALPQSGLRQAAVYYEVLAEGSITRIIAIFHGMDSAKIGLVRSARHYFADFALDYDAIFIHHGGSPQGYDAISDLKIQHLDGMTDGNTFWRDPVRSKQSGMFEHSSYTDAEKIKSAIEKAGFRAALTEDEKIGFDFNPEAAVLIDGTPAENIYVPFSEDYTASFSYDKASQTYQKFHEDSPQIDEETGEQLAVTNVLIQIAGIYEIAGDDAGRRDVRIVGSGSGYCITGGRAVPITWEKTSHQSPTEWRFENGDRIKLNPGKTWICVVSPKTEFSME